MMNSSQRLISRSILISNTLQSTLLSAKVFLACKFNIFYWLENFCWTHDPRQDSPQLPFIPYPFQKDAISWILAHIQEGRDGLVEKSRDMGVSWMFVYIFQYLWQFGGPGNDFHISSRKEEFVDRLGNMDTLFEKLRYNIHKQPSFLLPDGYDVTKNENYMRLVNPATGSYIKGEAMNLYLGTGGRYKAALIDEFAKCDNKDESAWRSMGDSTPARFPVSSANGKNNYFYKLKSGDVGDIDVLRLHWKEHPLKTQSWYDAECKRRSKVEVAAEIDIDYTASVSNKAAEEFNYDKHIEKVKYDKNLALELNCDFNIDPMCWSVSFTVKGHRYTFKEYTRETTLTVKVINEFCKDFKDHKQKMITLYGDASGKHRSTHSHQSDWDVIKDVLKRNSWAIVDEVPRGNPPIKDRINALNKRLCDYELDDKSWETIDPSCKKVIESLEQSKRKDDGIEKDGAEHHFDAFSYQIAKRYPVIKRIIQSVPRH